MCFVPTDFYEHCKYNSDEKQFDWAIITYTKRHIVWLFNTHKKKNEIVLYCFKDLSKFLMKIMQLQEKAQLTVPLFT